MDTASSWLQASSTAMNHSGPSISTLNAASITNTSTPVVKPSFVSNQNEIVASEDNIVETTIGTEAKKNKANEDEVKKDEVKKEEE